MVLENPRSEVAYLERSVFEPTYHLYQAVQLTLVETYPSLSDSKKMGLDKTQVFFLLKTEDWGSRLIAMCFLHFRRVYSLSFVPFGLRCSVYQGR